MKKYSFAVILMICFLFSCEEKEESKVSWASPSLKEFIVTPINGGATITYTIPNDAEILYIMAEYERNGKIFTEKSSVYKNALTIEGFNTQNKVKATLYKVNRVEQRSEPLVVEFEPLESPISITSNSLSLQTGFGGIVATWINPVNTELGVRLMIEEDGALETREMYFSARGDEKHAFRGFPDELTTFAISFEDKWGNISDTTIYTTTPYFEVEIAKPYGDARATIPYDNVTDYSGTYNFVKTTDGIVGNVNGWLSVSGSEGLSVTWDMKQVVKLSRMTLWPRATTSGHVYWQVNVLAFEVWGTNKLDPSKLPPADKSYWLDEWSVRNGVFKTVPKDFVMPETTFKDDWVFLGRYIIDRLDLKTPVDLNAITAIVTQGHQFDLPIEADPVRYIRFYALETNGVSPPTNNYVAIGEVSFFGDNTVPQQ